MPSLSQVIKNVINHFRLRSTVLDLPLGCAKLVCFRYKLCEIGLFSL